MVINLDQLKSHYSGKKVFVTGHSGFKGSWLLMILQNLGAVIKGYSLPPKNDENIYDLIKNAVNHLSVFEDINNLESLEGAIIDFKPDVIFHLAAQPLVIDSYLDPLYTIKTNVLGTANLLESVKKIDQKVEVVIITTDKVYKNLEWFYPYRENDLLGGKDPYSSSKACAELIVNSYRDSFFNLGDYGTKHHVSIATARAGNVIGGGDFSDNRIIVDIVKSIVNKKDVYLRYPNAIRPWQHVLEPLIGYLYLGLSLSENPMDFSTAFNFGPDTEGFLTVNELTQRFIKAYGEGTYSFSTKKDKFNESQILKLDTSKAKALIGWSPILSIDESIQSTANWYKQFNNNKESIVDFTCFQINSILSK